MDITILSTVLLAALLHAMWNAVVKIPGDALVKLWLINGTAGIIALMLLPTTHFPSEQSWPYLFASVIVHQLYSMSLLGAYRVADYSQIYPIARGIAPLLVGVGAYFMADENLSLNAMIGLCIASVGIMSMAFAGGRMSLKSMMMGLLTGSTIASYTVLDGIGGRVSDDVESYILWLFVFDAIPLTLWVLVARRGVYQEVLIKSWKSGIMGGLFAFTAYALVIWAMTHANMSQISALRETSVIFATLIGIFYLKERFLWSRIIASVVVVMGVLMMRIG